MILKFNNLVNSIRACRTSMNENLYRKMLGKALVLLHYNQCKSYTKKDILTLLNRELEREGLEPFSHIFVTTTLEGK